MDKVREPENSWEISYIFHKRKPKVKINIEFEELFHVIGRDRIKELNEWLERYYCHEWFLEHIL